MIEIDEDSDSELEEIMDNKELFYGGAIYFECYNETDGVDCALDGTSMENCDCNFNLINNNQFQDNYALHNGGAVYAFSKQIDIGDS
jgi:predicted outer membrane repeat protein